MTQGVETRLDGEALVVRIPMRFQRRGGRNALSLRTGARSRRPPSCSLTARWSKRWRKHGDGRGC
jgi:hypothetical protein